MRQRQTCPENERRAATPGGEQQAYAHSHEPVRRSTLRPSPRCQQLLQPLERGPCAGVVDEHPARRLPVPCVRYPAFTRRRAQPRRYTRARFRRGSLWRRWRRDTRPLHRPRGKGSACRGVCREISDVAWDTGAHRTGEASRRRRQGYIGRRSPRGALEGLPHSGGKSGGKQNIGLTCVQASRSVTPLIRRFVPVGVSDPFPRSKKNTWLPERKSQVICRDFRADRIVRRGASPQFPARSKEVRRGLVNASTGPIRILEAYLSADGWLRSHALQTPEREGPQG